jgi:toxin-antitoxin system PIN domain toxin
LILIDANLLIYASTPVVKEHPAAHRWLNDTLNAGSSVGLPWASLLTFLRIVANPRVFERPPSLTEAWKQVERWLELDSVWIPTPTDRHAEIFGRFLAETSERADLVNDVHLATLAVEHGLTLCSADRDFSRFSGLRWENPLA